MDRKGLFQRVASSLIIPVTLLPAGAILLGAGVQFGIAPLELAGTALIRAWLPLFFGIGISIGFSGEAMGVLSVAAGFVTMTSVAEAVSGDPALNVGVLGGMVAGAVCTWLYNRVKGWALPEWLGLFSGPRLGPVSAVPAGVALGYLFGFIWPWFQQAILQLGQWVQGAGGAGAFVYGAVLRLLLPTGLHHILIQLVDTQLGGWVDPASGQLVMGEYLRFLAGDPSAGRLLSGFFLTLGFAPVGAGLALIHEARPEQRQRVAGLMGAGMLTAAVLGITEPVEFAFIFASPLLFALHALLSGLASLAAWALDVHMGGYALPMILINWHRQQNAWLLLPLGLLHGAIYYATFRVVIRRFRPPVLGQLAAEAAGQPEACPKAAGESEGPNCPEAMGRQADPASQGAARRSEALDRQAGPASEEAAHYLEALGGEANLVSLEACMTRVRVSVRDPNQVDEEQLRRLGAAAVLRPGPGQVHVVVGPRAVNLAEAIRQILEQKDPAW